MESRKAKQEILKALAEDAKLCVIERENWQAGGAGQAE
jgi:hypothetical protein